MQLAIGPSCIWQQSVSASLSARVIRPAMAPVRLHVFSVDW